MGTTLTQFNQGQLAQLGNNINIAVATALPKVAAKFEPKLLLQVMEGRGQLLADKLEPMLKQVLNSLFVFDSPGTTIVSITEPDPGAFLQTRTGLWVSADFRLHVAAKARPSNAGAEFKLEHGFLMKDMSDDEIEAALPKQYLFSKTKVCAVIATMISGQWGGKEGKLTSNGLANLFYTSSCVVGTRWNADYNEWNVHAWKRGYNMWDAGNQVFSLSTVA